MTSILFFIFLALIVAYCFIANDDDDWRMYN